MISASRFRTSTGLGYTRQHWQKVGSSCWGGESWFHRAISLEIYRIKLPGPPTKVGEGKPENQDHAIIFTRGEALQTIDMSQVAFLPPSQDIVIKVLEVRFHYGHPDIFDRILHITRGGISKASKTINFSEDIFAGFNSTLRGGYITHHDYIQVGKGRDVGMNQISCFEAKVASGNGEQTLSRDVYRLGCRFDFYRMLSFYFTTVGFYFNSMVTMLTVYFFLYGRLYLVMSGLERHILNNSIISRNKSLEAALIPQSVFQMGTLLVLLILMDISLEKGFRTALGSKYRATGRGFVAFHAKFADYYGLYSRSHFVKGLELSILLILYQVYGESYRSSNIYLLITCSIWFLVGSWLLAPFIFNPSSFDWQKTVDDWTDWKRWIRIRGGIGIRPEKSWESWWDGEEEHLKYTNILGRVLEIVLALRFLVYQYGVVYHLNIAHHSLRTLLGCFGSNAFIVKVGRQILSVACRLVYRMFKAFVFRASLAFIIGLIIVCGPTTSDLWDAAPAFLPTGWAFLLVSFKLS
ncbi:Glucan synthase-like 7 [Theobroma cacao]|uniref:Glucan synthase-like 7 n=1 Tax=Theobroma cacao TaxID=3641 RepID=A0A061FS57_THECC|nr:Glucan synthase-like 7 [Theobroma cacao]